MPSQTKVSEDCIHFLWQREQRSSLSFCFLHLYLKEEKTPSYYYFTLGLVRSLVIRSLTLQRLFPRLFLSCEMGHQNSLKRWIVTRNERRAFQFHWSIALHQAAPTFLASLNEWLNEWMQELRIKPWLGLELPLPTFSYISRQGKGKEEHHITPFVGSLLLSLSSSLPFPVVDRNLIDS